MNSKIEKELQELVTAEVISQEVSQNISDYFTAKSEESPNRLFAIFGVLGSLLVGLGIILILAHNWDEFSKTTKTIWAFVPLVIGQLAVAYSLFVKKSSLWKDASGTFLFFAIGSSISLVSQIYNIPGSMASFLLGWIVLAAPLIYLLKSHALAVLHLIFATAYACTAGYANSGEPWWYLVMIAFVLPFYYKQIKSHPTANMTAIYHWLLPLSAVICLGTFIVSNDTFGMVMYVTLFGLFYNIGRLKFFSQQRLRINGYLIFGSLGTVATLIVASFRWFWEEGQIMSMVTSEILITAVIGVGAIMVLAKNITTNKRQEFSLFQVAFLLFAFIYAVSSFGLTLPWIAINLLVFALGIFAMRTGSKTNRFSILNYGLLIIAVLIACRFFDTNITFVLRGILFVLIGAGFFAANYIMYRKQQNLKNHE